MKKVFFVAILSLVSIVCVATTTAQTTSHTSQSSVTAKVAGINEDIRFETNTLVAIYNLMPQKVKSLCRESYKQIATQVEESNGESISYEGVTITPIRTANGIDLQFSYGGHTLVLKNYTKTEFDNIFK